MEEVIQTRVGLVESIVSVTSLLGLQVPKYPGTSYSPAWLTNKQVSSFILERSLPCLSLFTYPTGQSAQHMLPLNNMQARDEVAREETRLN